MIRLREFIFPKSERLVSNRQFRAVYARRLSATDGFLVLYARENQCGFARLGISIAKSSGKAVIRNRLKRLLREAFRQNKQRIPPRFDYVVSMFHKWNRQSQDKSIKQSGVKQLTFEKVRDALITLAIKLAGQRA